MKTLTILCVLSTQCHNIMYRECGGNADGLCAKHTFGESVVEMLLILCALHIFYSSHSMVILCSTHFGIFLSVQYCKVCGGVLGTLALRVQCTLHS